MDSLYIVIPAYNEAENIKNVINDWYPIVEKYNGDGNSRMVIINDGSIDNTYDIVKKVAETRPLLIALNKPNGGHGATVLYGYRYAIQNKADYIFQTDSDGQTLPSEFDAFWKRRTKYDMVIGWRRGREDGLSRLFVTKVLKLVVRLCFGVNVRDANTPFRLMKRTTLEKYIDIIPKDYFLTNVIVSVIFARKGCKVCYMPITFRPRQGGVNSINLKKIFGIGKQALKDFKEINKKLAD